MNSFNKLLKFSKKKKKNAIVTFYGTLILLYTTRQILLLYNCHSFNKYILLKSGQWVSSLLAVLQTKKYSTVH